MFYLPCKIISYVTCYRSEFDGDLQSQLLSKANEEDKNCSRALSVVSTVVRAAKDLLHRALAVDGKTLFFNRLILDHLRTQLLKRKHLLGFIVHVDLHITSI